LLLKRVHISVLLIIIIIIIIIIIAAAAKHCQEESERSLPREQQLNLGSYPQLDESSPHLNIPSLYGSFCSTYAYMLKMGTLISPLSAVRSTHPSLSAYLELSYPLF